MKQLSLTNSDKKALVDDEIYDKAIAHSEWYVNGQGYVISTRGGVKCRHPQLWLHHLVLGPRPAKMVCDHRDMNTLNYQRSNVSYVSYNQNAHNTKPRKNNRSGFKGVTWHKNKQRWHVNITANGKTTYLGSFTDKFEAAKCYDKAATERFGELARTNLEK